MTFEELIKFTTAVKPIAEVFVLVAAPFVAGWTVWTYNRSIKLEKAKWIRDLYEKFYEHAELKKVRNLLDSADTQQIHSMVKKEEPAFTDYLNFFEFLGYLHECEQIKTTEVLGLFDYYLKNLRKHGDVQEYIENPDKGFEKLQKLLKLSL